MNNRPAYIARLLTLLVVGVCGLSYAGDVHAMGTLDSQYVRDSVSGNTFYALSWRISTSTSGTPTDLYVSVKDDGVSRTLSFDIYCSSHAWSYPFVCGTSPQTFYQGTTTTDGIGVPKVYRVPLRLVNGLSTTTAMLGPARYYFIALNYSSSPVDLYGMASTSGRCVGYCTGTPYYILADGGSYDFDTSATFDGSGDPDGANCLALLTLQFDKMTPCIGFLFLPPAIQYSNWYNSIHDDVLTKAPLGYFYRGYDIFTGTATSSLPHLAIDFPSALPFGVSSIDLTPWGYATSTATSSTVGASIGAYYSWGDASHSRQTFRQIAEPWWLTIVYTMLGLGIFTQIMGMRSGSHHRK